MLLTTTSPRFRLFVSGALLLVLVAFGVLVTLVNVNTLTSAGWHMEVHEQLSPQRGCQYYFQLTADNRPEWFDHGVHWSAQNRVRTSDQLRMVMTLYVSGKEQSLFVMGLVSTYDTLARCSPGLP